MAMKKKWGWVGVDFDGTLAKFDRFRGHHHTGDPIPREVNRVKKYLAQGYMVKLFTARVSDVTPELRKKIEHTLRKWCRKYLGQVLEITNCKDQELLWIEDDKARQVEFNTGKLVVPETARRAVRAAVRARSQART